MDWHETDHPQLPLGAIAPMQQHPFYGMACAALGAGFRYYRLGHGQDIAGHALVLLRHWPMLGTFALMSRGPVFAPELSVAERREATRGLIRELSRRYRGVMGTAERIDGLDPLEDCGLLPMVSPGSVARLGLAGDAEHLRKRAHGKWRNRLVRAEGAGLEVQISSLPVQRDHWLLKAELAQARNRRYRRLPPDFTLAWAARAGREATRLFSAQHEGKIVAAMLFLTHGRSGNYHIGWSGDEGRKTHAHTLLLWKAAEWFAARGYTSLDLGTLDTERSPGLARFKLGIGAEPVQLGATCLTAPGSGLVARVFGARTRPYASSSASQYRKSSQLS